LCLVLWKASSTIDGVNKTLATVNAPCTGFHGSVTCGPIAQMSQTTKNIGILAAQGAEQVKQTGAVLTSAAGTIQNVGGAVTGTLTHVNTATDALTGTADAASKSLTTLSTHINPAIDTANATIGDAGAAIRKLQPVEDDADRMVKDFDARVTSPDVDRALKGVADTSEQAALTTVQITAIATDIRKAADQATAPQPWWKKILNYGTLGVNVACLATHSCPF